MKRSLLTLSILTFVGVFASTAQAKPYHHTDVAKVTSVDPVYKTVKHRIPKESCWVESVREERPRHQHRSSAPTIIGGIIGGVIGNEVGRGGDNKKIGAVVGSVLGMSIAKDIQREHHRGSDRYDVSYRDVERCETTHHIEHEQVLEGYNVGYRYQGREYSTMMHEHPGKNIRVSVNVSPAR